MMQGRRHRRPLHDKARAMACNARALPDLRADAVWEGLGVEGLQPHERRVGVGWGGKWEGG